MKYIQKIVASGYLLIILLIGCIVYIWRGEWQEVEMLESDNRHIYEFRKAINNIHIQLMEFSLLGETILEWNDKDLEHYHTKRIVMDSMLCHFKAIYPAERIDSLRHLFEYKEQHMRQVVHILDEQQAFTKKIARQVPVIVQKSMQGQPKKTK